MLGKNRTNSCLINDQDRISIWDSSSGFQLKWANHMFVGQLVWKIFPVFDAKCDLLSHLVSNFSCITDANWGILEIIFIWPRSHFKEKRRIETVARAFNYITFVLFYGKPIYVQTIFIIFDSKHEYVNFVVQLWIIYFSHFLAFEFPEPNFDGGMLFLLFRKGAW